MRLFIIFYLIFSIRSALSSSKLATQGDNYCGGVNSHHIIGIKNYPVIKDGLLVTDGGGPGEGCAATTAQNYYVSFVETRELNDTNCTRCRRRRRVSDYARLRAPSPPPRPHRFHRLSSGRLCGVAVCVSSLRSCFILFAPAGAVILFSRLVNTYPRNKYVCRTIG